MNYGRLILTFIKTSLQNEMAYRFNFFINILNSILGLLSGIGGLLILYANKESLNGWGVNETLALVGIYMIIQALKELFIGPSLDTLAGMGGEIESGNFDFTLLKPIPVQFYISLRNWSLWSIFDIIIGIGILCSAIFKLNLQFTPERIIIFIISLVSSQVIMYSFMLIFSSIAFWYRGTFLLWIWNDLMQTGRYPVSIYPGFLKQILTWIIPVGFMVTVPAEIFIGQEDSLMLLGGVILAALLFFISSVFFKVSLRKYTSASS